MQLLDLINNKYKSVSVVGMAKNSGKTVTLNEIILQASEKNITIGLTSIGRDGEKQDIVTYTEKPLIFIEAGSLIATAEEIFNACDARLEILEITDYRTSLGRVIIARALNSGYVQVAGPATNGETKGIVDKMLAYGAQLVIVDGAIDRKASASPAITDAAILATGAVLSRDMGKVIEESAHQVDLLNLKVIEDKQIKLIANDVLDKSNICIVDKDYQIKELPVKTALNSGRKIAAALKEDSRYVLIKGSLVPKTLKDVVESSKLYKGVNFVVKDATKIFINSKDWKYFMKLGVKVGVLEGINLLAVTVNPYSPLGYYFSPKDFLKKMRQALRPIPVLDVLQDGGV